MKVYDGNTGCVPGVQEHLTQLLSHHTNHGCSPTHVHIHIHMNMHAQTHKTNGPVTYESSRCMQTHHMCTKGDSLFS